MKHLFPILCLLAASAHGALLEYHGRVLVKNQPFTGPGHFVFALTDEDNEAVWTSGALPEAGRAALTADAVPLAVTNGHYRARLGDTEAGQPPLDELKLLTAPGTTLRVWFHDGTNGWHRAGTDVSLDETLRERRVEFISADKAEVILRGLRTLRTRLEQEGAAMAAMRASGTRAFPEVAVPAGDAPGIGAADAPLVMVEFVDYACPFSRQFHQLIMPELTRRYVGTGKLRVLTRHFPSPARPDASVAVAATACAAQAGELAAMQEVLRARSANLSVSNVLQGAAAAGVDTNALAACLAGESGRDILRRDLEVARLAGVSGTPSVLIGRVKDGKVTGSLVPGLQPLVVYDGIVKAGLKGTP